MRHNRQLGATVRRHQDESSQAQVAHLPWLQTYVYYDGVKRYIARLCERDAVRSLARHCPEGRADGAPEWAQDLSTIFVKARSSAKGVRFRVSVMPESPDAWQCCSLSMRA